MKKAGAYKTLDWLTLGLAYLFAICVSIGFALDFYYIKPEILGRTLMIVGLVFYILLSISLVPMYVLTCISSLKTNETLSKHNMIIKLCYIPFFILNIYSCVAVSLQSATITPFLIPLVIALVIINTYFVMLRTSLSNTVYFVKRYIKKELKVTPWAIISIVMSFFFVIDVISGIILYNHERNQNPQIIEKKKEKKYNKILNRINKWNKKKKHMSILPYKVISIVSTSLLYISSTILFVFTMIEVVNLINLDDAFGNLIATPIFIASLICIGVCSLAKLISGVIYGRNGEEDPTKFAFIIKMIDIVPSLLIFIVGGMLLVLSSFFGWLAIIFIPFIVLVIFGMAVVAMAGVGIVTSYLGTGLLSMLLCCVWGTSLSVFAYHMNQRIINNKKFKNASVIVCLVLLWFPILDIVGMIILYNKNKNGCILRDTPLIELK